MAFTPAAVSNVDLQFEIFGPWRMGKYCTKLTKSLVRQSTLGARVWSSLISPLSAVYWGPSQFDIGSIGSEKWPLHKTLSGDHWKSNKGS